MRGARSRRAIGSSRKCVTGFWRALKTPQAREAMQDYAARVAEGTITPTVAAQEMLDGLKG